MLTFSGTLFHTIILQGVLRSRAVSALHRVRFGGCNSTALVPTNPRTSHFTCKSSGHSVMAWGRARGGGTEKDGRRRPGFDLKPVHVGIIVHKVSLQQVFLPVCRFPISASFHQCSIIIYSVESLNWRGIYGGIVEEKAYQLTNYSQVRL
jgi:hypothetical protein